MIDTVKNISSQICRHLNTYMTNLHVDHALQVNIDTPRNHNVTLMNWTIAGLNLTNMTFDHSTSNFMLIEPSQRIKLYFNNVSFALNFTSLFQFNPGFLNYQERREVEVSFNQISSVTMFLKLDVDRVTKGVNFTL